MSVFVVPMDLWLSGISHNSQNSMGKVVFCGLAPGIPLLILKKLHLISFIPIQFLHTHTTFLSVYLIPTSLILLSMVLCPTSLSSPNSSSASHGSFCLFLLLHCFWSFNLSILFNQFMIVSHTGSFAMNCERFFPSHSSSFSTKQS